MIDYQRIFHTGHLVADLPSAMARYSAALGVSWAPPFTFEALPLWTPRGGQQPLTLEVTYSREGPQHIEIQRGPAGSFYDPALGGGFHTGIWVDDVNVEVAALQARAWTVLAAGATPDDGYGLFASLMPPGGGATIELCSSRLLPAFERWWSGEPLG